MEAVPVLQIGSRAKVLARAAADLFVNATGAKMEHGVGSTPITGLPPIISRCHPRTPTAEGDDELEQRILFNACSRADA
jgi:hypothetical protein